MNKDEYLVAPFPWFGGKRKVAAEVWSRFGPVQNYVEPFFGSGAVLFKRPDSLRNGTETVNDLDGFVCNAWRSIQLSPMETAHWADQPVMENDLHARHVWLIERRDTLREKLEGDPEYHDPKIAGWWIWGICTWIGGGFCGDTGPWSVADGALRKSKETMGVARQLPHLGTAGLGVNSASVKRQRPHLGNAGMGVNSASVNDIFAWFDALSTRLRRVRVCCGDWSRICGFSPTVANGLTGVFLDPPYGADAKRDNDLYRCESTTVATEVREWAIEAAKRPDMRIALCGYEGEHEMPDDWEVFEWKTRGGYGNQAKEEMGNKHRERIWFSPACLKPTQGSLFSSAPKSAITSSPTAV